MVLILGSITALPFINKLSLLEMTGKQIKEVLEQDFSLERGMIQVSGLNSENPFSSSVMDHIKANKIIDAPQMGRLIPIKK